MHVVLGRMKATDGSKRHSANEKGGSSTGEGNHREREDIEGLEDLMTGLRT
jgi:hypothetical protein